MKWGAKWEQAEGLFGQTYAISTKGYGAISTLSIEDIKPYVVRFIDFTKTTLIKSF